MISTLIIPNCSTLPTSLFQSLEPQNPGIDEILCSKGTSCDQNGERARRDTRS